MSMTRVIIESPYAGDIEANTAYARAAMRHSLDRGEFPLASHLLYTQPGILNDSIQAEREKGIQAGYEWMLLADLVVFYVDRGWSKGMIAALKMARLQHRKVTVRSLNHNRDMEVPDWKALGEQR